MPKAAWNNQVIAEAAFSVIHRVEVNIHFPLSAVKAESRRRTRLTAIVSGKVGPVITTWRLREK